MFIQLPKVRQGLLLLLCAFFLNTSFAQTETIPTGSFIINMSNTNVASINDDVKPYGLIYDLMRNNNVPIKWVIEPTKAKDGADFIHNGITYRGGTFIIPAQFRNAAVNAKITSWQAQGVVGATSVSDFTAPIYKTLTAIPNWTFDATNGSIAQAYLTAAGITLTAFPNAYNFKLVSALDCCNDFFVMPHADPTWSTHNRLFTWNRDCLGSIWAACHAVSALENSINPADPTQQMNFLSTRTTATTPTPWPNNSLKLWGQHSGGTPAYTHTLFSDPVAQYMGVTDLSQLNGSEQIYIPKQSTDVNGATRWRVGANIVAYDPTQVNVLTPDYANGNVAATIVYGRGMDEPGRGFVMYEAGHSHMKGTTSDGPALRAFLNFSFFQVQPKAPQLSFTGISAGQTVNGGGTITGLNVSATSPLMGITFTYQWSSSCGGSFSNATGATTNFTAPATASTIDCLISCVVTDNCGRKSFQSFPIKILGAAPPTVTPDVQAIDPGCGPVSVTKNVLTNDVEPDGQPMTLTSINGNSSGSLITANGGLVTFMPNGDVSYTSAEGFIGIDVLNYTVCDNTTPTPLCSNSTYTISVGNVANVPNAVNDVASIAEDLILSNFNVLANDLPLVAGPLTVSGISTPVNGKVSINPNNTITYVPNADFAGTEVLTYKIVNSLGYTRTATLTITVTNNACDAGTFEVTAPSSASVTLPASADTYLDQNAATTSTGASADLNINHRDGNRAVRTIIKFDLTTLPAGTTVTNANLRLYANRDDVSYPTSVHRLISDWTESANGNNLAANWTNRIEGTPDLAWTTAGGDFDATVLASRASFNAQNSYSDWSSAALGTLVQNWKAGTTSNFGLLLKATTENINSDDRWEFNSRTAGSNVPQLVVDYIVPGVCGPIPARAPLGMQDTATTNSSTAVIIPVATNDELFGQPITSVTISTAPSSGSAIVVGNSIQYTPGAVGIATLQYTVTTANGSDVVRVYINVTGTPVNAIDDTPAGALSGVAQTITVKANDVDPEGTATATVTIATAPKNGTATVNGSGQIVYTPNAGFTGNDTLRYSICEPAPACGVAACDTASVFLIVQNRAPIANNDTKDATPCVANTINLTGNDTDAEGNSLSINIVSIVPADGSALVANPDGTITFTPQASAAATYTVTYNVTDNGVTPQVSNNATVTINVPNFTNTAPVAVDDYADTTNMDEVVFYNVLDNDTDTEGHLLSNPTITVQPLHGTAVVLASGAIQYTPNIGFAGADTLTYQVCDIPRDPGTCLTIPPLCSTAKLHIFIKAPNSVVANNDENSTWVNTPVSGGVISNDFDPEGDIKVFTGCISGGLPITSGNITVSGVDATGAPVANAGTLTINANGTYTFNPANNFTGVVTVPYTIADNQSNAAIDTAFLKITVNSLPAVSNSVIANNDENTTLINTAVSSTLFGNDTDPQSNTFTATAFMVDTNSDGVPDAPGTIGTAIQVSGVTSTGLPVNNAGSLTINANGTYTFTPAADFTGTVNASYTITDALGAISNAVLTISILPDLNGALNNAPAAGDDFAYTSVNTPVSASFVSNDNDPNANPVSLNGTTIVPGGPKTPVGAPVATAQGGTIQYFADGTYTYTPPAGYVGPDSVGYEICDVTVVNPQPLCTKAFIHLLIGVDNTTKAINDETSTWQDVNVSGGVVANDFDAENHTQTFGSFLAQGVTPGASITSGATVSGVDKTGAPIANAGTLTFAADGSYTFDPGPAFTGTVTIPYTVCDNGNLSKCDTAYLTITVDPLPTTGINTVIANNDENVSYGATVGGSLFVNDRDPQKDAFTVTSFVGGTVGTPGTVAGVDVNGNPVANAGTLTINANGSYTFTPAPGFVGAINVPYTITDANGAVSTAILHIDVLKDPNGLLNDPPVAGDDFGYTTINLPVTGSFISNDSDPNADPVSYMGVTINPAGPATPIGSPVATPAGGTVQFFANGTYTYTPPLNYVGPDRLPYTICDVTVVTPQPLCADATIHLLVGPGINIAGRVWNDANGDIGINGTEPFTNIGNSLHVNLVDALGNDVATTLVAADGTYNFNTLNPGENYSLQLSTNQGTVGSPAPAVVLPSGWTNTGESRNGTSDGGTEGVIDTRNFGFTNTVNFDFGIERLPNSDNHSTNIPQPMVGTVIVLNGGSNPPVLSGSDPEDCNAGCTLSTRSVTIDAVPSNSDLYYNGVLVSNGQTINNFNPNLLEIRITAAGNGSTSTSFQYSYVDLAAKKDPTPATYTLTWLTPLPVTGLSVTAKLNGSIASVEWKTETEINSDYFVVERSIDNVNFTQIGTVAAAGNSTTSRNYSIADDLSNLQQETLIYYRIRQVDLDARFILSNVAVVRQSKVTGIRAWPNPFTESINININSVAASQVNIKLLSGSGQLIANQSQAVNRGTTQVTLSNLNKLATGVYFLQVSDSKGSINQVIKFVKE